MVFLLFSFFVHAQEKIAFLSDVHFLDLFGQFSDTNFMGFPNPKDGKNVITRTMDSQLRSTRLFNENYFAFLVALEDMVKRDIKIVALPGDFADDGQALILEESRK